MSALALTFHWSPSELDALTPREAIAWGLQLEKIYSPKKRT
jgi:hypothetical protein